MTLIKQKVFCIGFHKTGTTSLGRALTRLGYRVTGPNGVHDPDIRANVLPMACELIEQYDAFQDNPWPIIFREMDQRCPDSKFILSLRDTDSWLASQVRHFGTAETPMREWIYGVGCPEGNEDIYRRRYDSHNRDVLAYFESRPDDLLVVDLTKGDGWDELCPFLEVDKPPMPFPHSNKAQDRENRLRRRRWQEHLPAGLRSLVSRFR